MENPFFELRHSKTNVRPKKFPELGPIAEKRLVRTEKRLVRIAGLMIDEFAEMILAVQSLGQNFDLIAWVDAWPKGDPNDPPNPWENPWVPTICPDQN